MAEQTFRSPGFYEQEIELVAGAQQPIGIPGGVIGTSLKGPAFVPVTVASMADFESKFGGVSPERFAPYAVNEFLKHKQALTFTRVLGAGANSTLSDASATLSEGIVKNAGFKITSAASTQGTKIADSSVQFIVARHFISASGGPREEQGFPIFTDNPSFPGATEANLIRGMIFAASGTRILARSYNEGYGPAVTASLGPESLTDGLARRFKLIVSSSAGASFASDDSNPGVRIYTASLDPADSAYISRVLNTDPDLFAEKKHLLYLDLPIEKELVPVMTGTSVSDITVAIASGSTAWIDTFGRFDTRYSTARTTSFISQPFGAYEYDLFHFETITDGEYGSDKFKVSVSNVQASTDLNAPYGTFDITLREFGDDDINPKGVEYYPKLSLDPKSTNYIARMIGDKKVRYDFDADEKSERRLIISGKYPNRSINFRVVMNEAVDNGSTPAASLPFGFRGIPVLKTVDSLTDDATSLTFGGSTFSGGSRLHITGSITSLSSSLFPPLPLRFKVTRGPMSENTSNIGEPGSNERTDSRLHWGVVIQSMPLTSSMPNAVLNYNVGTLENNLVKSYTKFQGIMKKDVLVTGSAADVFNANKFTLSRVALANTSLSDVTGTASTHMKEAAYVRNGSPSPINYQISYGGSSRVTLGTLVASSSIMFNRFASFNKFTNIFYGGFDGLNILDRDNRKMNDRASSMESGYAGENGKALGVTETGLTSNAAGTGVDNNIIASYRSAIDIMTDEISSNINLLMVPGIRESLVTTYASNATRDYSLAMFIRDIAYYDDSGYRIFDDTASRRPSIRQTSETFVGLNVDNNYVATYFPDVYVTDSTLGRKVKVPSSIAAFGAIALNDKVAYPWFAPAGFNRASLDFVGNVQVRLNQSDRDTLYDARINPIATFPSGGFVIFGQKTLQLKKSALDRVNVRRLLLEVKRVVSDVAGRLLFEQNTPAVRSRFIGSVTPQLALVQAQAGIEKFRVIMDDSNNTPADAEQNRLNGKIIVVPTKTIEFIAVDFVITPSGVSFE